MVETIETDIGHWVPAGIDPADGIRQLMASRIFALHFVDVTKDGKPAPYGTGISNLDKVLETLKEKGAPVILTCEYEQWDDLTEKNVRACVEWFNKHAEK